MKKYFFAALFAAVGIASAASQNLLQNGDFSIGLYGWSNRSKPAQKITTGADADVPGGGAALCVDIVEDGGKNHGQLVQFRQGVKPGALYRVSALVRSDAADMAYVQAKLMNGKTEGKRFTTGTAKQADEWVAKGYNVVHQTFPGYHEWNVWRRCAFNMAKLLFKW